MVVAKWEIWMFYIYGNAEYIDELMPNRVWQPEEMK